MKRLRTILLFLLAGAVVNVAVAWVLTPLLARENFNLGPTTFGYKVRVGLRELPRPWNTQTHWMVRRVERSGFSMATITVIMSPGNVTDPFDDLLPSIPGLRAEIASLGQQARPDAAYPALPGYYHWTGFGWPMISLSCRWPWFDPLESPPSWPNPPVVGGLQIATPTSISPWPYDVQELRALPLIPLWPGFLVNTLFYTVVLWAAFLGLVTLKRLLRRRGGRCIKCAYDLRGADHDACPECGAAV